MNCEQLRESLLAEPLGRPPQLSAHLASCLQCTAFAAELAAFETQLRRALEISVPPRALPALEALPATVTALQPIRARSVSPRAWLALAASVAAVAVLASTLLAIYPRQALAAAIVGHASHEPESWSVTAAAVPASALAYVLSRSGVRLAADTPQISYAHSCSFRGWVVPHLAVQTEQGPMIVMVLRHEHVARTTTIDEQGFRGVIVPAGVGAIAVLSNSATASAPLEAVAATVAAAVTFTD